MKRKLWLTTERLNIYHPDKSDYKNFCKLLTHADVMEYTFNIKNKEEVKNELQGLIKHYKSIGFAAGSVHLKNSGEFIGRAGLFYPKSKSENPPCLICLLLPNFWRQGYGTETLKEIIKFGFETLEHSKIFGLVHENNFSSQKLVKKFTPIIQSKTDHNGKKFHNYIFSKENFMKS